MELEKNGCSNGSVKMVCDSEISLHSSLSKESISSRKGLCIKLTLVKFKKKISFWASFLFYEVYINIGNIIM